MQWLMLEATFLADRYGGKEWPPAPMRLLQAIVAGQRCTDFAALHWLESHEAPLIDAERDPPVATMQTWVPNNTEKGTSATTEERTARVRSIRRISSTVRYLWPVSADEIPLAADVIELAALVHTFGTGHDMCRFKGQIVAGQPASRPGTTLWKPIPAIPVLIENSVSLRVPVRGSLASIEERYQAGVRRFQASESVAPVLPPAQHGACAYVPANSAPRQVILPVEFHAPTSGARNPSWHCGDAVVVAGMLRHACMRATENSELADWASGHAPDDDLAARLSWVPLPSIGHEFSDRRIRRAMLVARIEDSSRLAHLHAALIDGMPLVDEHSGEITAIARPLSQDDHVLSQYRRRGRTFQSVTPLVLPGDFADNARRERKLLMRAFEQAGLDTGLIEDVQVSSLCLHPRDVPLKAVKLKAWNARGLILRNVLVKFSEPVAGPLVLGRGRHFGLGLMCANPE